MSGIKDIAGQQFGRLTVISFFGKDRHNKAQWNCLCDCGKTKVINASSLIRNLTHSCGCLHDELLSTRNTTHGLTDTPENRIWRAMKSRCNNPNIAQYKDWGGRGIKVCQRWSSSFENFLADMGKRPSPKHSIDRIDNNGHYSCGHCAECIANNWMANCRWTSKTEQANNARNNHLVTYKGETKSYAQWSSALGIDYRVLQNRITNLHWSTERAIETPIKKLTRRSKG